MKTKNSKNNIYIILSLIILIASITIILRLPISSIPVKNVQKSHKNVYAVIVMGEFRNRDNKIGRLEFDCFQANARKLHAFFTGPAGIPKGNILFTSSFRKVCVCWERPQEEDLFRHFEL